MRRFPWDQDTDSQYQRYGVFGIVLALCGAFIGMPGAFVFLAIRWYGRGGPLELILGILFLAFGLWGMWQLIFGARSRPGRIYRDRPD